MLLLLLTAIELVTYLYSNHAERKRYEQSDPAREISKTNLRIESRSQLQLIGKPVNIIQRTDGVAGFVLRLVKNA